MMKNHLMKKTKQKRIVIKNQIAMMIMKPPILTTVTQTIMKTIHQTRMMTLTRQVIKTETQTMMKAMSQTITMKLTRPMRTTATQKIALAVMIFHIIVRSMMKINIITTMGLAVMIRVTTTMLMTRKLIETIKIRSITQRTKKI